MQKKLIIVNSLISSFLSISLSISFKQSKIDWTSELPTKPFLLLT